MSSRLDDIKALASAGDMQAKIIADMVIELPVSPDDAPRYTCRHHDAVSGDCTIYADRPVMCAEYPYRGGTCKEPDCTYVDDVIPAEALVR